MDLPIMPPVEPMLAKLSRELPRGDLLYEPKWDGFRCLVFRDGAELVLQSRGRKELNRYFPELEEPLRELLPPRVVLDGELVVPVSDGLDFDAISNRIHPAQSRVRLLAEQTPARFVGFDVLALDGSDLTGKELRVRRTRLEELLEGMPPPLHLTPATTDPDVASDWFERFEGAGLDGVVTKDLSGVYEPGRRVWGKVKHLRTSDCVVGGYRMHKDGEGVGSLMLGLYATDGRLHHVGVASSFTAVRRQELLDELRPYRLGDGEHPWIGADGDAASTPRGENRWNSAKDTSWEPLRIELVAEVAYEQLQGDRFRHSARFQRWRPDRDPASCTYEQLEVPPPAELTHVFAAG